MNSRKCLAITGAALSVTGKKSMEPMFFAQRLLGVILIAALGGCSTMAVTSDYDPSAKFTGYKTYKWMSEPPKKTGDPRIDGNSILASRIQSSVERQLAAKGYEKQSSGTPSFLVGYHASIEKKTSVRMLNDHYRYGPGWGWSYRGPQTYVYDYDVGTLILDIVDPKTRKLLWRGTATGGADPSASGEARQKKINEAVTRILETFPPK
jgi:hypothetical protein